LCSPGGSLRETPSPLPGKHEKASPSPEKRKKIILPERGNTLKSQSPFVCRGGGGGEKSRIPFGEGHALDNNGKKKKTIEGGREKRGTNGINYW